MNLLLLPKTNRTEVLWIRTAISLWVIVLAVVCVRSALKPTSNTVYHIFSLAGENWRTGHDLYDQVSEGVDVYRYSPLAAAGFAPWSFLPLSVGNALWRIFNTVVFLSAMLIWVKELYPGQLTRTQFAQYSLLALPMSVPSLNNGQINPLLMALMLMAPVMAKRGYFFWCAVLLSAAIWIKLYPVALALLLALVYFRRLTPWLVVTLIAGMGLPFLLQNPQYVYEQHGNWLTYLRSDNRELVPLDFWPRDIRLLFHVYGRSLSGIGYASIQLGVALAMAGLVLSAKRCKLSEERILEIITIFACIWMTIFGPATESATFILLAPALAISFLLVWRDNTHLAVKSLVVVSYIFFVSVHIAKWFPFGNSYANLGIQPIAGLLFLFGISWQTFLKIRQSYNKHKSGSLQTKKQEDSASVWQDHTESECDTIYL